MLQNSLLRDETGENVTAFREQNGLKLILDLLLERAFNPSTLRSMLELLEMAAATQSKFKMVNASFCRGASKPVPPILDLCIEALLNGFGITVMKSFLGRIHLSKLEEMRALTAPAMRLLCTMTLKSTLSKV